MAAGADFEINIRARHAQVFEKRLAHALVIVLPGMHQALLDISGIFFHGID